MAPWFAPSQSPAAALLPIVEPASARLGSHVPRRLWPGQEFLPGPKSSGHMTPKACRCRLHDREQGGGWRLAGGEPRGHGSTTVSIGALSLAVIWPTSFTGFFFLPPVSCW